MRSNLTRHVVVETTAMVLFSPRPRSFCGGGGAVGGRRRPRRRGFFRWVCWDAKDDVDARRLRHRCRASSSSSSTSTSSSSLKAFFASTRSSALKKGDDDEEPRRSLPRRHHRHVSVVVGSNRGIGFAFAKHLLESNATIVGAHRAHGIVVATCRQPSEAKALHALRERLFGFGDSEERLDIVRVDVLDEKTIEDAARFAREKYGRVDLLVHAAGVLHEPEGKMVPETSIADNDETQPIPVIANVSARVSSISDNKLGGWYSYRGGKTALNQMTRTAHLEFSRKKNPIAMVLLHPGTVDTELSAPFKKNVPEGKLFTPEYSAGKLLEVLKDVTLKESGKFYDYAGVEIPW